jgi:hypothetical protein
MALIDKSLSDELNGIDETDAMSDLKSKFSTFSKGDKASVKAKLKDNSQVLTYLLNKIPPTSLLELQYILKVANSTALRKNLAGQKF